MTEFITPVGNMVKYFKDHPEVKFTDTKCSLCWKPMLNTQLAYSIKYYKKPLCRSCQRLEKSVY